MLRVLSISTLFPNPARPGFGRFVFNQMRGVSQVDGIALTMVNPIGMPPWPLSLREPYAALRDVPRRSEIDGLEIHHPRFLLVPKLGAESNPKRIAAAVLPLARRMHAQAPFDLVDAQFFFPDGPAAAIVARELGLPLAIKARGSDIHYWGTRPSTRAQIVAAAQQASCLLSVSHALKRDMVALGMPEERIAVHYTGLDRSRFRVLERAAARAQASSDLGVPPMGPLLVTPGALIAIKGQRLAIAALEHLEGVHLALAGTGEDETGLKAYAASLGLADRVRFLGQVSHEMLPYLLAAADAVVLPSEREGLANAWIEALACGTPLVIPDVGGAREVVNEPTAGRIAARDPQAIADAVRELLDNPPAQAEVAANARHFSWEANAAQLAGHYARAAGAN